MIAASAVKEWNMSTTFTAKKQILVLLSLAFTFWFTNVGLSDLPVLAQQEVDQNRKEKDKKEIKASDVLTKADTKVFWVDRGDISTLDLYWGSGAQDKAPQPPFTFKKEATGGTNPKIDVVDSRGVNWRIKFDEEVHAEIAATRIVWACGYLVEENYHVPSGNIDGVKGLGRAKKFVGSDGAFTKARFERRPDNVIRRGKTWSWNSNPYIGTKELSGLAILNALLNNWDAKESNNEIIAIVEPDGTTIENWFLISDWGGTFGKMGGVFSHTKWDLEAFRKQPFIEGVSGGALKLNYSGKMSSALKIVPLEHARWFAGIIGRLTDEQLRATFKTAGASEAEISGFAARLREKINELEAAVGTVKAETEKR
jgi:hypothetical protein